MTTMLSPRRWRAIRAANEWVRLGGDLRGCPLDVVELACGDAATMLVRDLNLAEVAKTCDARIALWVADEAKKKADEAARAEYLAKRAADYRLTADPVRREGE